VQKCLGLPRLAQFTLRVRTCEGYCFREVERDASQSVTSQILVCNLEPSIRCPSLDHFDVQIAAAAKEHSFLPACCDQINWQKRTFILARLLS
jgi:hypothetical protein